MYFTYKVTLVLASYGENEDEREKKFEQAGEHFSLLGKLFSVDVDYYEAMGFDQQWQDETFCITVSFARPVRKFRSAYNLLKIFESSVILFSETLGYHIQDVEYPDFESD